MSRLVEEGKVATWELSEAATALFAARKQHPISALQTNTPVA